MKFLAVIHEWHVDSRGFSTHEIDAKSREEAEGVAAKIVARLNRQTCNSADYIVLDATDQKDQVVLPLHPIKLTLRERISGRFHRCRSMLWK